MSDDALRTDPLFAILSPGREVPIGAGTVRVVGVSWNQVGKLLGRFPQLISKMIESGMISYAAALATVPESVPYFLAAGIGRPDDETAIAILGRLSAVQQVELIDEVLAETIGGDRDFFVERLKRVAKRIGLGAEAETGEGGIRMRSVKRAA